MIRKADLLAPVIYTELTKMQILQLEKRKNIAAIFLHETQGINDLEDSIAIANSDDAHSVGYKGYGVKVAVWERGPDKKDDLKIAGFYDPSESNTSNHARHTHGIIKNKEKNKPKGHAPPCTLYSANDYDLNALKWAVKEKNCTVISQSFHRESEQTTSELSFDDIYKDWLALHWPYPTIVKAGLNSLAVGNHDDDANAMSSDSVFKNPSSLHSDRELPEISANGTGVTAAGITMSGTNMAAPAVAGCVAIIQSVSSILKSNPEGTRAIILAGATKNVRAQTWWQDVIGNEDERDGSGAVNAYESVQIAKNKRSRNSIPTQRGWDVGNLQSSDFGRNNLSIFSYQVKIPSHWFGPRHLKVALTWNSKVDVFRIPFLGIEFPLSSKLTVDFDLMVYDSQNNLVGYSGSWDNSYEIAEFEANRGETYTIKIRRWSGSDSTWFGIAWTVTSGLSIVSTVTLRGLISEEIQRRSSSNRRGGLVIR